MELVPRQNYEEMSHAACDLIIESVRRQPELSLCLATGGTPTRTYQLLVEQAAVSPSMFKQARIIKLDEWGGLAMDDPATCEVYLQQNIIQPLGIPRERTIRFESSPSDPQAECQRIRACLGKNGPIDLCILGLGANGHLGFNEPADALQPFPHVATLATSTLSHPMVADAAIPLRYGLTLGMADILSSRQILLLVNGAHKQQLMAQLLGPGGKPMVTSHFPASYLWLHPNVTVICDQAAMAYSSSSA